MYSEFIVSGFWGDLNIWFLIDIPSQIILLQWYSVWERGGGRKGYSSSDIYAIFVFFNFNFVGAARLKDMPLK